MQMLRCSQISAFFLHFVKIYVMFTVLTHMWVSISYLLVISWVPCCLTGLAHLGYQGTRSLLSWILIRFVIFLFQDEHAGTKQQTTGASFSETHKSCYCHYFLPTKGVKFRHRCNQCGTEKWESNAKNLRDRMLPTKKGTSQSPQIDVFLHVQFAL